MIQKLRDAIDLFIANLGLFSSITLIVWLPALILSVYLSLYVFPETTEGNGFQNLPIEFILYLILYLISYPLYVGAILDAAARLKQGMQPTYRSSLAYSAQRLLPLLGTQIIAGLVITAGLIALIIPGLILALCFTLVDAVVVLEGVAGIRALKRSIRLTKGKRWNILGALILTSLGIIITISIISFLLNLPLLLVGKDENFLVALINDCISQIILTIPIIVLFLYYWEAKNQEITAQSEDDR